MSLSPELLRLEAELLERGRREGREEGRREAQEEILPLVISTLLEAGWTIGQIAEQLQVDVSEIQKVLEARSPNENHS